MVPGHEITGSVAQVGAEVEKFKVGDLVGVGCFVDSCRTCFACKSNLESYCEKMIWTYNAKFEDGTPTFGGYSTQIVVDQNYVVRIPKNLPLDAAAPLMCAGITTYSPLRHWNAGPGKEVAIIGLGGLGHIAIKIAKAMQCTVTVISQSMKKKDDATRLGADNFFATDDPKTFEALKDKFDLILNTVSASMDINQFVKMLKVDGAFVALGVPEKSNCDVAMNPLVFGRKTIAGSLIGGVKETQEMLDFCGKHNITCDIELIPIQKVNEAYERILKSDVRYRFVIDAKSLCSSV